MESQENNIEAIAENVEDSTSVTSTTQPNAETTRVTMTVPPESTKSITTNDSPVDDTVSYDLLKEIKQLWENYFGEGKKANLTIAITILSTIPVLIAASVLLEFLNKLPLLPSAFELVGFGYSVWFVYRYLLLASTRKELVDGIIAWKNKIFG